MKKIILVAVSVLSVAGAVFLANAQNGPDDAKEGGKMHGFMKGVDANNDGAVSKDEFIADANKKFTEMDSNKDNKVTQDEMQKFQEAKKAEREQRKKEMEAKQEERFKEMDTDKDGKISIDEMKNFRGKKKDGDKPETEEKE